MACATLSKLLLVILNFVFLIISLAFVAVGGLLIFFVDIILEDAYDEAKEEAATNGYVMTGSASDLKDFPLLYEIGIAFLVIGAILFVLNFLSICGGCCSTCCRLMLLVFALGLIILMVVELVVFSLFLTKDSALHKKLKSEVQDKITSDYDELAGDAFTSAIIIIHEEGNCCGMEGVQDFGLKSHRSCEVAEEQKGCYDKMQDLIQDDIVFAGLAVAIILALQLLQVICALVIFKDEKSKIMPI